MLVHNWDKIMGKEKVAVPMLEEFLRQMRPPSKGQVYQPKLDWWFTILTGVAVLLVLAPIFGLDKKDSIGAEVFAFFAGWGMFYYRRTQRAIQIQRLEPGLRAEWERWERARRLPHLAQDGLHKYVPGPVLQSLEKAARSWHHAREELTSIAVAEPQFALEIQTEIDALMMAAVATVGPVTRKDDQGRRAVRLMEEDQDLMNRICQRIDREAERLSRWADDTQVVGSSTQASLRERLARARSERATAEAELNETLGSLN